jgi:hypothetical protein
MKRLSGFLLGVVVGGGLVYGAQRYHVVRTEQGFEAVPKLSADFTDCYVDLRKFGTSDWSEHKALAAAIVGAKKEHIFHDSAADSVRQKMSGLLDELTHLKDG